MLTDEQLDILHKKLYKSLIMEIDAIDTGVKQAEDSKYEVGTHLSRMVGAIQTPWNAPKHAQSQELRFKKAMKLCE